MLGMPRDLPLLHLCPARHLVVAHSLAALEALESLASAAGSTAVRRD
jgi:hypothetical protein